MSPSHPKVPLRPGQPKKRKETAVFVLCFAIIDGAAYDARPRVSGGCCKLISHSRCGLELGQALLLAAAFDEVMGLLVAIERTEATALRQPESLNGNQRIAMP